MWVGHVEIVVLQMYYTWSGAGKTCSARASRHLDVCAQQGRQDLFERAPTHPLQNILQLPDTAKLVRLNVATGESPEETDNNHCQKAGDM